MSLSTNNWFDGSGWPTLFGPQFSGRRKTTTFNMTPMIDIVFLLIIFFLVVCQFIEAENFPVAVPDECRFAQSQHERETNMTTVTVMKTNEGGVAFAVGAEKIDVSSYKDIAGRLAELIDFRLGDLPLERRVVTLRVDKDVCFAEAQYALAGIAESTAANIQLAALKDKQLNSQ